MVRAVVLPALACLAVLLGVAGCAAEPQPQASSAVADFEASLRALPGVTDVTTDGGDTPDSTIDLGVEISPDVTPTELGDIGALAAAFPVLAPNADTGAYPGQVRLTIGSSSYSHFAVDSEAALRDQLAYWLALVDAGPDSVTVRSYSPSADAAMAQFASAAPQPSLVPAVPAPGSTPPGASEDAVDPAAPEQSRPPATEPPSAYAAPAPGSPSAASTAPAPSPTSPSASSAGSGRGALTAGTSARQPSPWVGGTTAPPRAPVASGSTGRYVMIDLPADIADPRAFLATLRAVPDPGAPVGEWDLLDVPGGGKAQFRVAAFPTASDVDAVLAVAQAFNASGENAAVRITVDRVSQAPGRLSVHLSSFEGLGDASGSTVQSKFRTTEAWDALVASVAALDRSHLDYSVDVLGGLYGGGGNFQLAFSVEGCTFHGDPDWAELSGELGHVWLDAVKASRPDDVAAGLCTVAAK